MRWIVIVTIAAISWSCGGKQPPPPAPAGRPFNCPAATAAPVDVTWPESLRIVNRSADSVSVYLDRCLGHTRVGYLGPRETRVFAVPSDAVTYRGRLRFHLYSLSTHRGAVETLTPRSRAQLTVEIPEQPSAPCAPELWVNGKKSNRRLGSIPRDSIEHIQYNLPDRPDGCPRIDLQLRK